MVLKNERESIQKSIIDILNLHVDETTDIFLKKKQDRPSGVFIMLDVPKFTFIHADWVYTIHLKTDTIYEVARSNCVIQYGKTIELTKDKPTSELYHVVSVANASVKDKTYCPPYSNHLCIRKAISHSKKSMIVADELLLEEIIIKLKP